MDIPHEAVLLRIFTSMSDRWGVEPLYLGIVERARALHMSGATVVRGALGFGQSGTMHKPHVLPVSEDLPIIVEIVDSREKIEAFLPVLDEMMESGLVTIEKAHVLQYGRDRAGLFERLRQQFSHHRSEQEPSESPDSAEERGTAAGPSRAFDAAETQFGMT